MALEFLKGLFRSRTKLKPENPVPFSPKVITSPEELSRQYRRLLRFKLDDVEKEMEHITNRWNELDIKAAELRSAIAQHEPKE